MWIWAESLNSAHQDSQQNVHLCGRNNGGTGCSGTYFSTQSIRYSEVCGRVIGYQYHSTDAFGHEDPIMNDIDSFYVEGVSITHGLPRQHIWTFACSLQSDHPFTPQGLAQCPCNSDANPDRKPDFIGDDYYCESGNPNDVLDTVLYRDDRLWDNKDCGSLETECCNKGLLPYFHKVLEEESSDDIEFRICGDQGIDSEDTRISIAELYIR